MTRHRRSHLFQTEARAYQRVGAPDVVIASFGENTRSVWPVVRMRLLRIYNQDAGHTLGDRKKHSRTGRHHMVPVPSLSTGYPTLLFFVAFRVITRVVYFVGWRCSNRPRKFFAWTADAERLGFQLAGVHSYVGIV
ncbi:hypothetical protein EDD15DRAFT_2199287 [Pisolithus albus]|nr:hypothetical protein EDD15DRAFT_2199287 [Pisolithus albus]